MKLFFLFILLFFLSICYADRVVAPAFLWDASKDTLGRVITGSPDEISGYWYYYDDSNEGGASSYTWVSDMKDDYKSNFFGQMVQMYGSIQGSYKLYKGQNDDEPYIGLGFNIWSENQEGVDISEWGGLCIEYSSTMDFMLRLGHEDAANNDIYPTRDIFRFDIGASKQTTIFNESWSKIRGGLGPHEPVEDYIKKIANILLVFSGPDSTKGDFKITKIGSLGTCDGTVPVESISLPRLVASAPVAQFRKAPEGFQVLDKSLVGKPYVLFDLNGVQIRSGNLPAILKTPAAPAILRVKERIHYLR
jgi:hypothetical protein